MTKFFTYFIATVLMFLDDKVLSKGQPEEWQMGFQEAASPLMAELAGLHDFVFWIITFITVFVFVLPADLACSTAEVVGGLQKSGSFELCNEEHPEAKIM